MRDLALDYCDAVASHTENPSKYLLSVLGTIRTFSHKHGSEKQRELMGPLLDVIVGKPCNWNKYQCARCFESFLKEYVEEWLDLLLAVSGFAEEYVKLSNASKRRDKYANTHLEKYGVVPNKTWIKREEAALAAMLVRMTDDYNADPNHLMRVVADAIGINELNELGLSELIQFIEQDTEKPTRKALQLDGWGDNSADENCYSHRPTYTAQEIAEGAISERAAVINSIFDETNDERKFVSVCGVSTIEGNRGASWQSESIEVEDGEIYTIRMYIHNNNLNGYRAVAEDTKIKFTVPDIISNEQEIRGYIKSSNATPSQYWASVTLKSQTNVFSLEYIEGSCTMINGVTGSKGCKLRKYRDDKYTTVGYKYLDGEFPGGRQYACYISIQVRVKFEAECRIKTTQRIQNNPDNSWYRTTEAEIGDLIECQFFYKNTGNELQENIMLRYVLPDNMEYIPDTTVLYNSKYQTGVRLKDDTVTTSGINVGHYKPQGNAYVRFCVRVVDNNLSDGLTCLINWGAVTINGIVAKDNAQIYVEK